MRFLIFTALNPVARIVVLSSGHGRKFAIRWRNVSEFLAHVASVSFHRRVGHGGLVVDDVV